MSSKDVDHLTSTTPSRINENCSLLPIRLQGPSLLCRGVVEPRRQARVGVCLLRAKAASPEFLCSLNRTHHTIHLPFPLGGSLLARTLYFPLLYCASSLRSHSHCLTTQLLLLAKPPNKHPPHRYHGRRSKSNTTNHPMPRCDTPPPLGPIRITIAHRQRENNTSSSAKYPPSTAY